MDLDDNALVFATNACAVAVAALCPLLAVAAAMAGPTVDYILRARGEKTAGFVVDAFGRRGFPPLDEEQKAELVPMVYRIIEATRQGEYEHTLKVLAAFIAGETGQKVPEAGNFARMAKRLEGLTQDELRLIAHIAAMLGPTRDWLGNASYNLDALADRILGEGALRSNVVAVRQLKEGIHELAGRGFLLAVEMPLIGGTQTSYQPTDSLKELLDKAGAAFEKVQPVEVS